MPPDEDLSRRRLLQIMGAGVGAAALSGMSTGPSSAIEPLLPFSPRGPLKNRPNFLVVVVDEMRYAPVYESAELKAWRRANLRHINSLNVHGLDFLNHHIMSSACSPSRASIFTGQYPSLHGVTQTDGAAKSAVEQDLYWLDPTTVPTMGHYFRAAGYETYYKGKWHVSHADLLQPGTQEALPSYDENGVPTPGLEERYLLANRLGPFGFDGWIGPEPHGRSPLNSGSSGPDGTGRDAVYAQQGARQLARLRDAKRPWVLVTSFVNPHDIAVWGDLTLASPNYYLARQLQGSTVPRELFDERYDVSRTEDLATKPSAQASQVEVYPEALQPTQNTDLYRRFYYQLHANVDTQIGRVLDAVRSSSREFQRDTIVIFLSDHGELLGSHGGQFQKWHQAYDEVLRVPFVIHNPVLFPEGRATEALTSHADLLPTMLGLAGVDLRAVQRRLRNTHTQVRDFVGRDLTPLLLGTRPASRYTAPQYFMTDDEPSRGDYQIATNGTMYRSVIQPNHIETVVAQLPTGMGGALEQWKYSRYFDNPKFWSEPGEKDVVIHIDGVVSREGPHVTTTSVKREPVPDQIEVYNVTRDPTELDNLADSAANAATIRELARLLGEQRRLKRLEPSIRRRDPGIPGGIGV